MLDCKCSFNCVQTSRNYLTLFILMGMTFQREQHHSWIFLRSAECRRFQSKKACRLRAFSSGLLGFKGCRMSLRKLLVSRIKMETWEMFGCTRFRGNTWMSHPLVCHWVLSGSDCSKRALCFSGLNHSGLIKKGLAAQMPTVLAEQTDKWKCVCVCVCV